MKYIIFLILISCIIFIFISCDKKVATLKKQLLVANNQNTSLRAKLYKYSGLIDNNIQVKFLHLYNNTGLINSNTDILIAPISGISVLNKSVVKMEVIILDKVEIKNKIWYYVSLPLDSNVNSRGWVREEDFSSFYNSNNTSSNSIKKIY